ncbi:MAG: hypothetical protein C0603_10990 [Denitrovibrio sp.]|nr:MAG: hypothetical protein C0603_10990 [Denitrovibrio sp.]
MIEEALKANLLIVEDDSFSRTLYKKILSDIDKINIFELETAENAIEYIKENKPDMVIMDYMLPGMNGLEATKQIIMAHPDTFIFVISGDERSTLEEEMLEVGAISFIEKPVRGKLLYFTIHNFVEIILANKRLKSLIASPETETIAPLPVAPTETNEESNATFVDSFQNTGMTNDEEAMLSKEYKLTNAASLIDLLGADIEYVHDFIESYDELKYTIESLQSIVNADILKEISRIIGNNSKKLAPIIEFPTITHALKNINEYMDDLDLDNMGEIPMKKLAVFLTDFFEMYEKWVRDVFITIDADDIHFMDIGIMSFWVQMSSIFSDLSVLNESDEDAADEGGSIEFF